MYADATLLEIKTNKYWHIVHGLYTNILHQVSGDAVKIISIMIITDLRKDDLGINNKAIYIQLQGCSKQYTH